MTEQDETRPLEYIATLLGISPRRVNQLADQGVIPKTERGRYDLRAAVSGYMEFLRGASRRGRRATAEGSEGDDDAKEDAETRLAVAKAEKAEIELEQIRGDSHAATDVEREWCKMLGAFRSRMLSIPTKAAPLCHNEATPAGVQVVLKTVINEALAELAEYDPERFTNDAS